MYYQSVSVQSVDVKSANQRPGQARTGGGISVSRMPDQAHRESGEQVNVLMWRGGEGGKVTSGAGHAMQDIGGTTLTGEIVSPRLLEIVNCSTFVLCSAPLSPRSAPFQAAVFITWNYTDSVQQDLYRIIQIL